MKIAVIMGRGVEGCGVTKNVVEFQKLKGVEVFATMDKTWGRENSMDFDVNHFRCADWDTVSKKSKKYPDLMACKDVINRINEMDAVVIFSVPSKGHPEDCQNNFVDLVKEIKVRKSIVQVDHNIQSITRNARLKDILDNVDVIMTHSTENPFAKWARSEGVTVPITTAGVGYNFDEVRKQYWKPIEEQRPKSIRWIGRLAGWKGYKEIIDFHDDYMLAEGFVTMLEGLEASIAYTTVLYKDKDNTIPRNVVNHFRSSKAEPCVNKEEEIQYGSEEEGKGAYAYPPYTYDLMMKRMAKTGFGVDLYNLKPDQYGSSIEYCHADSLGAGVVPIFHKHFGQHVIHAKYGKPCYECENSGTLWYSDDPADKEKLRDQLIELSNDNAKREEWRENAFQFWKDHADAIIVYEDIINKTLNFTKELECTNREDDGGLDDEW